MPTNEPIRQPIEVDYQDESAKAAARDIKAVGNATEKSGEQAKQASPKIRTREQRLTDLRREINELALAEARHQQRVDRGRRVGERAADASRRRERRIEKLSRALAINEQNQRRATESIQRASGEAGNMAASAGTLTKSIGAMAGAFAGPAGVIAILDLFRSNVEATNRALEEQARLARDAALATLELHALSFGFNAEDEAFVQALRVDTGRTKQDVATAFTTFKSATPSLDPDAQRRFFSSLATGPGQATTGSLLPLGELGAKASAVEPDSDKLNNLIATLVQQSGEGDPGKIAKFVTPLLEPAKLAGLSIEETFGLFAFGTRTQEASKAATQLRNLILRFQGDEKTKESLSQFGVADSPFLEQIAAVGAANPDTATLTELSGLENFASLASLVNRTDEALQAIDELRRSGGSDQDLFADFLSDVRAKNPSLDLAKRQASQEQRTQIEKEQGLKGQQAALARSVVEQLLVQARERGDLTPLDVEQKLETFDTAIGAGFSPSTAAQFAENAVVAPSGAGLKTALTRSALGPLGVLPAAKRSFFGTPELSDVVDQELAGQRELTPGAGAATVTQHINQGTIINQAGDPTIDDLSDGRPTN